CCTSASSPYAAGVAALLLSAAKQQSIPYSVASLGRALRFGARFLPDVPAHQQGNGLLNIEAAWTELQKSVDAPRILVSGANAPVLAAYAAGGNTGPGLFEREGWTAGMRRQRTLHLTRTSGPKETSTYELGWLGNDGTFTTARSIDLPLDRE